jgi:hypothetical protein
VALLLAAAPAINYLGKRGSFVQYFGSLRLAELDPTFSEPIRGTLADSPTWGQQATMDDFGDQASFDALNSFSPAIVQRGVHRKFVETAVPLTVYNAGQGFVHCCAPGVML